MTKETLWHVTVLSNLARAYDKYPRRYCKSAILESTFPDRFFLLREEELEIGIQKAGQFLEKLGIAGNQLVALRTTVRTADLHANTRTGLGRWVAQGWILVDGVASVGHSGIEEAIPIEEAMARSLQLLHPELAPFDALQPRSFSVLPIARGCQASCPFCFSEASASAQQDQGRLDLEHVRMLAEEARNRGADRFVITGGGEPGLVKHDLLCRLIRSGSRSLGKSVLITNAHHLARQDEQSRRRMLSDYADAGMGVLSISRHHHEDVESERIMSLATDVGSVIRSWNLGTHSWPELRLRLICVLQRGGLDNIEAMTSYVDWATELGVAEICFKELYVSTSIESFYHRHAANDWSYQNQIPLALVLEFAAENQLEQVSSLPWGAPIFAGTFRGRPVQVAAYTEPSLIWERGNRIARSWNLMADGRCLVSLEDRSSEIELMLPT